MADKTEKRIYLVRHGFSEHNVGKMSHLRDPNLTALGEAQARQLHAITKDTLQQTAGLLVTSPLRRAMSTAILGFPALRDRLSKNVPGGIVVLDLLQEVERKNCNCALYPPSELASSNDGMYAQLDFSALSPNYADKSGIFDPDNAAERARQARSWLRVREESEIVVTSHGDFLRFLVYGCNDFKTHTWDNFEVKVCVFKPSDAGDHEAWLEVVESIRLPSSTDAPTSSGM